MNHESQPALYPWQAREIEEFGGEKKRGIFASPRLGKTLAALVSMEQWGFDRALVVAPLIVCPQWASQLRDRGYTVINGYSGPSGRRALRLTGKGVYVANYDSLATLEDDLIEWHPQAIIGDESHYIKGVSALRAKAFRRLSWRAGYTRLLTGTPTPNHYGDLWGQLVALDKKDWGGYEKFAQRYLVRHPMFPSKVTGHRNVEELQARLLQYVSIVRREDVFGPDTYQEVVRTVPLPNETRKLYDRIVKDWLLEAEGVDATHILKRLIRLQQLSAGFLPNDKGEYAHVSDHKLEAVKADLEGIVEAEEKTVIFHRFKWESEAYATLAGTLAPTWVINGGVPIGRREEIMQEFRDHDGACVVVVQSQAGGVGISFAEATHALFTSRDFSYTTDQQARDRIYKPGSRRCITYYECDRTVDQYISKVLATKQSVHDAVVNADRQAMAWGQIGG